MTTTTTTKRATYMYGVFCGTRWGMTRNLRTAMRTARQNPGSEVRRIRMYPGFGRDYDGFDSPTFYAMSEPLPAESAISEAPDDQA